MRTFAEQRIRQEHLERKAIVYVRQSSPGQVQANVESTRVQLGLREKALSLGWRNPAVIDDDLGLSAAGFADRPGFQSMLTQVALRQVGIILCIDASRLSRNSRDWANLFELCGHFDTLIADIDQVYDLSHPNDRLVLGIKGTVSELELSILRTRLRMGCEQKAARGELKFIVPPGYIHDHADRIVKEPDRRVQDAICLMFEQFDRSSSLRQLALWYRDTHTLFPIRKIRKTHTIAWEIPTPNTLNKLLQHPIYAGVYVYGRRTEHIEYLDGKLVKRVSTYIEPEECRVCIHDHHEAYITHERYVANRARLAEARPRWTMQNNRGAVRKGQALLPGLLRCGHCGAILSVSYNKSNALYSCSAARNTSDKRCLSFGSFLIERRIGQELSRTLSPLAMEAAALAVARRNEEQQQAARTARLQVEAAQYEADRAFEQFDLVDPKNRLVADTLEQRLNDRLADLQTAKANLEQLLVIQEPLTAEQRRTLEELARDFPAVWNHPHADATLRKRLLRTVIQEIIVTHEDDRGRLNVVIHWMGGTHTRVYVDKRATPRGCKTDPGLVETVRTLASLSDADIARILNMKKTTTPRGLRWTLDRVKNFRNQHGIPHQPAEDDADFLTGQQAAAVLGVSRHGLEGLFRIGLLHNHQTIDFAPWRIPREEIDSPKVREAVRVMKANRILPKNWGCPSEEPELFPMISKGAK